MAVPAPVPVHVPESLATGRPSLISIETMLVELLHVAPIGHGQGHGHGNTRR